MSSSTLPKFIQAQNAANNTHGTASLHNRVTQIKEFIDQYRQLPDDFLRIPPSYYPQAPTNAQQARAILAREATLVDMIDISVVEAQLVKNYGLLRMDLYCKIRVGHMVCETQTCLNGAKNPKWDGVYQFSLKPGIDSFHLEIYDEKQFSLDEKIAWLYEPIPPEVFQGITVERWFPLSGRLGPNKEGSILLVLSHKRVPIKASNFGRSTTSFNQRDGPPLTIFVPAANQGPAINPGPTVLPVDPNISPFIPPPTQPVTLPGPQEQGSTDVRPASEEDINQLSEMFPSVDKAVIKAVLENNHNVKEATISALLALG